MTTPTDEFDAQTLEDAARWELELLWDDLHEARQRAVNGQWSMECDRFVARIQMFTQLVGPIPWDAIQLPLLEDGTYQRIHADMGVDAEVDMVKVAETRHSINERWERTLATGLPPSTGF